MFIVVATDLPLFDSRLAFLCYHTGYRVTFQTIICHTTIRHLERTVTFVVWKSGLPLPFLFYLYLCRCFFATGSGFILVRQSLMATRIRRRTRSAYSRMSSERRLVSARQRWRSGSRGSLSAISSPVDGSTNMLSELTCFAF